jgi:cell division septum initiation protein DivIVA
VDVHEKLDGIIALVEGARAMPMSTSCVVNRGELLALLADLRGAIPSQVDDAQRVLDEAYEERSRLLSSTPASQEAVADAERIRRHAEEEAQAIRAEVDDYVDAKLANFEVVLTRTMTAVQRGRDRLRGQQQPDGGLTTDEYLAAGLAGEQAHTTGEQRRGRVGGPGGPDRGFAAGLGDGFDGPGPSGPLGASGA